MRTESFAVFVAPLVVLFLCIGQFKYLVSFRPQVRHAYCFRYHIFFYFAFVLIQS